jgi:hypothetical protein
MISLFLGVTMDGLLGVYPIMTLINNIDPKYYMTDSKINYMLGKVYEDRVPPMFGPEYWKKWDE